MKEYLNRDSYRKIKLWEFFLYSLWLFVSAFCLGYVIRMIGE